MPTSSSPQWPPSHGTLSLAVLVRKANGAARLSPSPISNRLIGVLNELQQLRSTLIKINNLSIYSDSAYVRARAFVVLSHGVIEEYLEGICLETVDGPLGAFNVDRKARSALLALLHYTQGKNVPETLPGGPWGVAQGLAESRKALQGWAKSNNGIKEKDVLRLLLPTGLKESDMSSTWLTAMSGLGTLRGSVAHYGQARRAQTPIDPKDALESVEAIIPGLCRVDARLVLLRDE